MAAHDLADILAKPISQQLLTEHGLARIAYIARDGTPRVIPVGFLWAEPHVDVYTVADSAKVKAVAANPHVALTIDTDGMPPRALLIRGTAEIIRIEGVPDEYIRASTKTLSGQAADDFAGQVRALYDAMDLLRITPSWAKLLDFETTAPSAVEEAVRRKAGG